MIVWVWKQSLAASKAGSKYPHRHSFRSPAQKSDKHLARNLRWRNIYKTPWDHGSKSLCRTPWKQQTISRMHRIVFVCLPWYLHWNTCAICHWPMNHVYYAYGDASAEWCPCQRARIQVLSNPSAYSPCEVGRILLFLLSFAFFRSFSKHSRWFIFACSYFCIFALHCQSAISFQIHSLVGFLCTNNAMIARTSLSFHSDQHTHDTPVASACPEPDELHAAELMAILAASGLWDSNGFKTALENGQRRTFFDLLMSQCRSTKFVRSVFTPPFTVYVVPCLVFPPPSYIATLLELQDLCAQKPALWALHRLPQYTLYLIYYLHRFLLLLLLLLCNLHDPRYITYIYIYMLPKGFIPPVRNTAPTCYLYAS